MNNAREEALRILYKIEYEGAYSNIALKDISYELSKQDKALATNLVYGVIDKKLTLDYIVPQCRCQRGNLVFS